MFGHPFWFYPSSGIKNKSRIKKMVITKKISLLFDAVDALLCMAGLGGGIRDQRRGLGGRGEGSAGPQGEGRLLSTQSKVKMMICSSSAMACLKLITL